MRVVVFRRGSGENSARTLVSNKPVTFTAGQLAQQFSIVAEEDSQSFGDRENHLAVRDIFEQLFAGPMRPYELTLFVGTNGHEDVVDLLLQQERTRTSRTYRRG